LGDISASLVYIAMQVPAPSRRFLNESEPTDLPSHQLRQRIVLCITIRWRIQPAFREGGMTEDKQP
jgi:hypothetical protein